jgi:carbonic anhydrase
LFKGAKLKPLTQAMQDEITPSIALDLLQKGNRRFIENLKINSNLLQQANETSDGEHPFAVILSCTDSRTFVELIFDQSFGDVFSVQIAGTVINQDILGSLEFGCKVAGAKIIVILGHTQCGAVKGACDHIEMGNLTTLLRKIQPAVTAEKTVTENRTSLNDEFVEKVAAINIRKTVQAVMDGSPILKEMIENGACGIVGGNHDISTGEVSFYADTMLGFNPYA